MVPQLCIDQMRLACQDRVHGDRYLHLVIAASDQPLRTPSAIGGGWASVVFNGVMVDTWGKRRLGLTAPTELSRDEFGSGEWGRVPLAAGGFMVPSSVKVTLDIEATKDDQSS
jgi:hypothetical protein